MLLPVARREEITVRELPDETMLYDERAKKAHCLNRLSAFVWKNCDGVGSIAALSQRVKAEFFVPHGEAAVQLALEQLSRRGLLQGAWAPLGETKRLARRNLLKKVALVASLPLIMTISARSARAQGISGGCTGNCTYSGAGLILVKTPGVACVAPKTCDFDCAGFGVPNSTVTVMGKCV